MFFFIVGSIIGIINSAGETSINTGLLAEHTVTKIFAHKICSIYTKKLEELNGDARQSPRQMEAETLWEGKGKPD